MSDSNIGARKKKNIRNNFFIINGVINEILNNKNKSVDIEIVDYRQCFDSMWLEETINDLYEVGIQDDELPLIYKSDETSEIPVNTPFGITDRETVHKIVMQGKVLAPLKCSVQVNDIGIYNFFQEQSSNPVKGYLILTFQDDLAIGVDLEL